MNIHEYQAKQVLKGFGAPVASASSAEVMATPVNCPARCMS